jgi:manganese efflux pump family protein
MDHFSAVFGLCGKVGNLVDCRHAISKRADLRKPHQCLDPDPSGLMQLLTIIGIATALAMDAFAVSIAVGISLKRFEHRQLFRLSWHFGLFQSGMTVIGWGLGLTVRGFIETYASWLAFGLLMLIGGNMIREAFRRDQNPDVTSRRDATRGLSLVVLSVATSIDALAVGLSLSLLGVSIFLPAVVIGLVAAGFTVLGMQLGQRVSLSTRLTVAADVIGGLVLWGIAFNVLFQHLR